MDWTSERDRPLTTTSSVSFHVCPNTSSTIQRYSPPSDNNVCRMLNVALLLVMFAMLRGYIDTDTLALKNQLLKLLHFAIKAWPTFLISGTLALSPERHSARMSEIKTRAHQEMRYPNVTWRITFSVYLFTTELRQTCRPTSRIF